MGRQKSTGAIPKMKKRNKLAAYALAATLLLFVFAVLLWCVPGNRYYLLDRSIWNGNHSLIRIQLALGADVNGRDYDINITPWEPNHPVVSAVRSGNARILEYFLDHGGDVNFLWGEGYSPLWLAMKNEDIACIRVLLDHGGNADLPTLIEAHTPRLLAQSMGNQKILEMIE